MSGPSPDTRKRAVADRFGAAADSYDAAAAPQRRAAALLADVAAQRRAPAHPHPRILEIGCGTGILTRHIRARWPMAQLVVSDISAQMVDTAAGGAMIAGLFMPMDGEAPVFEGPWFDLTLSNLAFQWFADLPGAVARLAALLRPGGSLLFSTMGADSFADWRGAHERLGERAGTPHYPALVDVRAMVGGYADAFAFDEHWRFDMGGARGFLRHLRAIGVTVPGPGHAALSPVNMRAVIRAYDEAGGVADYHIIFGRITRI